MGEYTEKEIIKSVERHLVRIFDRLRLDAPSISIVVRRMGSREYGCADASSDLDLYVHIPDEWAKHAKAIRHLLGEELESCEETMGGKESLSQRLAQRSQHSSSQGSQPSASQEGELRDFQEGHQETRISITEEDMPSEEALPSTQTVCAPPTGADSESS